MNWGFLSIFLFYTSCLFFPGRVRRAEECVHAKCHVGKGVNVLNRV